MKLVMVLALVLCIVPAQDSAADSKVYRWTDDDGTVHYSSKPSNAKAKPADLPRIMRGEVKLTNVTLETCEKHGGVNCQLGPDSDGSVICYDGYRNASARFRFSCQTAKLELNDIGKVQDDGSVKVFVRNSKSVKANDVAVVYEAENGVRARLKGPKEIDPLEIAEFEFKPDNGAVLTSPPSIAELSLRCKNCP